MTITVQRTAVQIAHDAQTGGVCFCPECVPGMPAASAFVAIGNALEQTFPGEPDRAIEDDWFTYAAGAQPVNLGDVVQIGPGCTRQGSRGNG